MNLLQKPTLRQNICKIELSGKAAIARPASAGSSQPFFNTYMDDENPRPAYFGRANAQFSQSGKDSPAGFLYEHSLKIRFPNGDLMNAERIREYLDVHHIYIVLSGGVTIAMGRNDYFQNSKPVASLSSSPSIAEITYRCSSIFPIGNSNGGSDHLLGEDIPVNFFNLTL